MKAIGIDIGTTTVSAVVFDSVQDNVVEGRTIQNDSFMNTGNEWERIQDVDVIIKKAKNVLDELLRLHPDTETI
jgi:sedoheptulokinase